eukprot:NODE_439_length_1482_cov_3002.435450_g323_i0.p1 GENE.NODE_439_length_1482_cov_3002.435450_g323_i0~~NODE_439_length_1482_cov_3002.435450_g323_i0.p1  ORF type:complete len:367 (+),score=100.63 NODE_439_length_1482_cov_3002.435450_g323_i0:81-1181(+)
MASQDTSSEQIPRPGKGAAPEETPQASLSSDIVRQLGERVAEAARAVKHAKGAEEVNKVINDLHEFWGRSYDSFVGYVAAHKDQLAASLKQSDSAKGKATAVSAEVQVIVGDVLTVVKDDLSKFQVAVSEWASKSKGALAEGTDAKLKQMLTQTEKALGAVASWPAVQKAWSAVPAGAKGAATFALHSADERLRDPNLLREDWTAVAAWLDARKDEIKANPTVAKVSDVMQQVKAYPLKENASAALRHATDPVQLKSDLGKAQNWAKDTASGVTQLPPVAKTVHLFQAVVAAFVFVLQRFVATCYFLFLGFPITLLEHVGNRVQGYGSVGKLISQNIHHAAVKIHHLGDRIASQRLPAPELHAKSQ